MAPSHRAKQPRTRTGQIDAPSAYLVLTTNLQVGCLVCRKHRVKCDERKPVCDKCSKLSRQCTWGAKQPSPLSPSDTKQYLDHFFHHCSRFLVHPYDEGNPFEIFLGCQTTSSRALLCSMGAVAAGHLSRTDKEYGLSIPQGQHNASADKFYTSVVEELSLDINSGKAGSDATLAACLLLCVYEISYSQDRLWLGHLRGAEGLIRSRGGPQPGDYLTRLFCLLDISGLLFSGRVPSFEGTYWAGDITDGGKIVRWPSYDSRGAVADRTCALMTLIAGLSALHPGTSNASTAALQAQWDSCPPELPDVSNDWRALPMPTLSPSATMENEAFSRTRLCFYGCKIYLSQIMPPDYPQDQDLARAIREILEIAENTPEGHGLETGLYWGLFMAGAAIFNDVGKEAFIRRKMSLDTEGIFRADRALAVLEKLWAMQHEYNQRFHWQACVGELRPFVLF